MFNTQNKMRPQVAYYVHKNGLSKIPPDLGVVDCNGIGNDGRSNNSYVHRLISRRLFHKKEINKVAELT